MPKLENAERRDRKLDKRKNRMKMHGKESVRLIQQEIIKKAQKIKQKERESVNDGTYGSP